MKKTFTKIVTILALVIIFTSLGFNVIYSYDRQNLTNQIKVRDSLITAKDRTFQSIMKEQRLKDSIYRSHIDDGGLVYDGVRINTEQIVKIFNKEQRKHIQLNEDYGKLAKDHETLISEFENLVSNYSACQDSVALNKQMLKSLDKEYGKNFRVTRKNGVLSYSKLMNKADTALLLYPYYKDKIKIDKDGRINIENQPVIKKSADGKTTTTTKTTTVFIRDTIVGHPKLIDSIYLPPKNN